MEGSIHRVRDVINGRLPDRPPLFDLLRNDAVINHFTAKTLTVENAPEVVFAAYAPAIDATRQGVRLPKAEAAGKLPDGREFKDFRWTSWAEHHSYESSDAYAAAKRKLLDGYDPAWTADKQARIDRWLANVAEVRSRLGEVFYFPSVRNVNLCPLYHEVGLEQFSYYLADCPDIIDELLELNTIVSEAWVAHLPADHGVEAVFLADDIAFKTGPFMSPAWFEQHYFPRLARVIAAWHAKGAKVLFHSDGHLMPLLDQLVECGIDGLNPIEINANMDVGEIHRRHPNLWMTGGIDLAQLLPHGSPREVADVVRATIDAAEGKIMIGSSAELQNSVPLANFLAMRDTVLDYRY